MSNWEEQYNNLFGEKHHKICEGKKCNCHKEVKQFIKDLRQRDRDELIKRLSGSIPVVGDSNKTNQNDINIVKEYYN